MHTFGVARLRSPMGRCTLTNIAAMDTEDIRTLIVVVVVGGTLAIIILGYARVYGAVFFKKTLAKVESEPTPPYTFKLCYQIEEPRNHLIFLRFDLIGTDPGSRYMCTMIALSCTYMVNKSGHLLVQETVGYGTQAPRPYDREIDQATGSSSRVMNGPDFVKAFITLTEINDCQVGDEIQVEGTIQPGPNTKPKKFEVFIKR